jgi:fibronectin-binding autotransporter adhesin
MQTRTRHLANAALLALLLAAAGALARPARAAESVWTGAAGDNDFSNPANWSAYSLANDFSIGKAPASGTPSGTAVLAGALAITGQYITIGYENGASGTAELRITGTLNHDKSNGILIIGRATSSATSHGAVYLSGNALLNVANELSVGRGALNSTGCLEIAGNAAVRASFLSIAPGASSGNLLGTLLLTDNGRLDTTGTSLLGGVTNSGRTNLAVATIAGHGFWSHTTAAAATYAFVIGAYGTGSLTLQDSGSLALLQNLNGNVLTIGRYSTGSGVSALVLKDTSHFSAVGHYNSAIVVGENGRALFQISGNATADVGRLLVSTSTAGFGVVALDGGRLTTRTIENRLGSGTLAFAGGTLQANYSTEIIRNTGGALAVTTTGPGAFIDSNGFNISNTFALAGDGGLAKLGAGAFTLGSAQTYTGTTAVAAGALVLSAPNALATSAAISLAGGTLTTTASQLLNNLSSSSVSAIHPKFRS